MANLVYKKFKFTHRDVLFDVNVKYSDSTFGSKELAFWEYSVNTINGKKLQKPLKYRHEQKFGWLLQSDEYRNLSYIFSSKTTSHTQINILPIIKNQIIYDWFYHNKSVKYEKRVYDFSIAIKQKYNSKILTLKEKRKYLKKLLKKGYIDPKLYQKQYMIIVKKIENLSFKIDEMVYKYKKRYFNCNKLKKSYLQNI